MSAGALADLLSWALLLAGSAFCVLGGIGLLRFPDFYTRVHAAGLTDTLGAGLILIGLMFQGGLSMVTIKLALILVFILITSPTATHALVKAAFAYGIKVELVPEDPENATTD